MALVGTTAGLLGGLFGVGGGLIIVPGLVLVIMLERRLANGTSLAATLPIALASLSTYLYKGNVDWTVAGFLASGTIVGAVIGTKLLTILPKRTITIVFIVTVLATAARLFMTSETAGRDNATIYTGLLLVVIGLATGTLSGLLGIGGGVDVMVSETFGFRLGQLDYLQSFMLDDFFDDGHTYDFRLSAGIVFRPGGR